MHEITANFGNHLVACANFCFLNKSMATANLKSMFQHLEAEIKNKVDIKKLDFFLC